MQPLSAVFSLQNFSQFSLEIDDAYLLSLSKLLFAFMTVPCPHTQQLCIHIKGKAMHPSKALETDGLARFDMKLRRNCSSLRNSTQRSGLGDIDRELGDC